MEIKLTKRGQSLVKRAGKIAKKKEVRKPIKKLFTLVHIEIKNGRKHEWSKKVWVDEAQSFSKVYMYDYDTNEIKAA